MPRARSTTTVAAVLVAGCLGLSACAGSAGGPDAPPVDLRIGVAYDTGGRGDEAFREGAVDGARSAAADLGGDVEVLSPEGDADGEAMLTRLAAAGFNPVIAVGFDDRRGVAEVAADHPETEFAILDVPVTGLGAGNLTGLVFAEEEGGFLAGVAAGAKSVNGHVGFIGDRPAGGLGAAFVAGATAVDPGVVVDTHHLPSGTSGPAESEAAAQEMYRAGADIVFSAGEGSGEGVVRAAVGAGQRAIGAHSDQYLDGSPEQQAVLMTSVLTRADVAVEAYVTAFADGSLQPGTDMVQDLSTGGVELSHSGGALDDIRTVLDHYRQQIAAGGIEVPDVP
ncbi:BMP family lipoprotein [Candidatus Blastococcus massiliensis]|uniref:BMP family lipoprotein n=1 Tax=Candidatus Blastococcus massiliensis TaxID=1470358 RepID=UPI0004B7FC66|nr:BMP family ABC transporter substrate-binding protein [Candidatus Blastococcus massiliensis]